MGSWIVAAADGGRSALPPLSVRLRSLTTEGQRGIFGAGKKESPPRCLDIAARFRRSRRRKDPSDRPSDFSDGHLRLGLEINRAAINRPPARRPDEQGPDTTQPGIISPRPPGGSRTGLSCSSRHIGNLSLLKITVHRRRPGQDRLPPERSNRRDHGGLNFPA